MITKEEFLSGGDVWFYSWRAHAVFLSSFSDSPRNDYTWSVLTGHNSPYFATKEDAQEFATAQQVWIKLSASTR